MGLKAEPQSPPTIVSQQEQPFVWPWIGVLANIPLQWNKGRFVGPSGFTLKQQLSERGFKPSKVEVLCSNRGHSGFALVHFGKDLNNGLEHAMLFERSFQKCHCGKWEWNNVLVCPSNKFYGWIAREDDYKFEGIVSQNLWKLRGLKSVFNIKEEEDRKRLMPFSGLSGASVSKRIHHDKLHSQVDGFSLFIDDLMKQKDEMVQRYHEDMRRAHHSAQKHLENIISPREKVTVLLEAQKQEIEMRSTTLVEGEVPNVAELEKIQKLTAILEQRKGDNLVLLVEKHKKENEKLQRGILAFEKGVEDKHVLELEIERMGGALRVMRHMGDAGDEEILEKIDSIHEQLKEKEEQYNRFEAMNQTLIVNEELRGTGKELIKCLKEGSRNMSTGIEGGGDIDSKPFLNVAKRKYSEERAYEKAMGLSSEWSYYLQLQDPSWNPFVTVEGSIKGMDVNHEKLKCLRKEEHGDDHEAYNAGGKKATFK